MRNTMQLRWELQEKRRKSLPDGVKARGYSHEDEFQTEAGKDLWVCVRWEQDPELDTSWLDEYSLTSIEERRARYRKAGYSRHDAWESAKREYRGDAETARLIHTGYWENMWCRVTIEDENEVVVGEASCGGILGDRAYLCDMERELMEEALADAEIIVGKG